MRAMTAGDVTDFGMGGDKGSEWTGGAPRIPLPAGISWTYVLSPLGGLGLAATPKGVSQVRFGAGPRWAAGAFPGETATHVFPHAFPGGQAIVAYLNGLPADLGQVPIDPAGTPFARAVWAAARAIPAGETRTYGEVARTIGRPGAARAVGRALGANPVPLLVPCHRVVAADGTLGGFTGGIDLKVRLLRLEGVTVSGCAPEPVPTR